MHTCTMHMKDNPIIASAEKALQKNIDECREVSARVMVAYIKSVGSWDLALLNLDWLSESL